MSFHSASALIRHGIGLPAPEAVYVDEDVELERIAKDGVVLHPGVRLHGQGTVIAAGAEIGAHGPAVLRDVALGRAARVASGTAERCVLLDGASLGPDAHVRSGTILEEESSTGHSVGLKQTILLCYATLGSQINFCDALLAGGRSRQDHSEVGSGFIHFNFTPFGARGDKATASLFGDVPHGVLLREDRIFLGGSGGVVGPVTVGYGTVLAAGSVYRRSYDGHLLVYGEQLPSRSIAFHPRLVRGVGRKLKASIRYIGELHALDAWYRRVRLPSEPDPLARLVLESGRARLNEGIAERVKQVDRLLEGAVGACDDFPAEMGEESCSEIRELAEGWTATRDRALAAPAADPAPPLPPRDADGDHPQWVRSLPPQSVQASSEWLRSIAEAIDL